MRAAQLLLCIVSCAPTGPHPSAANTLHPGVVNTELARYLLPDQTAWWQQPLIQISQAFALTPEQGAQVGAPLPWRRLKGLGLTGRTGLVCGPILRPAVPALLVKHCMRVCFALPVCLFPLPQTSTHPTVPLCCLPAHSVTSSHPPPLQTSIYLASSPEVEGLSGKYYDKCRPVSSNKESVRAGVGWGGWMEVVGGEWCLRKEGAGPGARQGRSKLCRPFTGSHSAPAASHQSSGRGALRFSRHMYSRRTALARPAGCAGHPAPARPTQLPPTPQLTACASCSTTWVWPSGSGM